MLRTLSLLLAWVLIPGCASFVTSSPERSGLLGRPLSVVCQYDKGYVDYNKYWCKGVVWSSCEIVVKATESEAEVKNGRTSIKDNRTLLEFTVRLDNLTKQDAGIYWCGIEKSWSDVRIRVNITVLPAPIFVLTTKPEEKPATTEQLDPDPTMETTTGVENSIRSPIPANFPVHAPFLILISLKTSIFLCISFAIIWMCRNSRQHSEREAPP